MVQHAGSFYIVGGYNEEAAQSAEAHAALSDRTVDRSTPTRVRSQLSLVTNMGCSCNGAYNFLKSSFLFILYDVDDHSSDLSWFSTGNFL